MERLRTDQSKKFKEAEIKDNGLDGIELTPKQMVIEYCRQFPEFTEDQIEKTKSDEYRFTRRLKSDKIGDIYLFGPNGKLKDVSAMHNIKPISTRFGDIRPPESKANKLDA